VTAAPNEASEGASQFGCSAANRGLVFVHGLGMFPVGYFGRALARVKAECDRSGTFAQMFRIQLG
jgi:hypothetical protein